MGTKIFLPDVRCAFLRLDQPDYYQGKKQSDRDQRRWDATGLIPATSPLKKMIDDAIRAEAKAKWANKADAVLASVLTSAKTCCFVDGATKPDYDGYAGNWALTSHRRESDGRPLVFDNDKTPIFKPDGTLYDGKAGRMFSGCYVNLSVEIYAYEAGTNRGIGCGLLGIQRVRHGDSFGGSSAPNPDAFGEVAEGADAEDLA